MPQPSLGNTRDHPPHPRFILGGDTDQKALPFIPKDLHWIPSGHCAASTSPGPSSPPHSHCHDLKSWPSPPQPIATVSNWTPLPLHLHPSHPSQVIFPKCKSNSVALLNKAFKWFPKSQVQSPPCPSHYLPLQPQLPQSLFCHLALDALSVSHGMLFPVTLFPLMYPDQHGNYSTNAVSATCCPEHLSQKIGRFPPRLDVL